MLLEAHCSTGMFARTQECRVLETKANCFMSVAQESENLIKPMTL